MRRLIQQAWITAGVLAFSLTGAMNAGQQPQQAFPRAAQKLEPALLTEAKDSSGTDRELLFANFNDKSSLSRAQTLHEIAFDPANEKQATNDWLREALFDKQPLVAEAALKVLIMRDQDGKGTLLNEQDLTQFSGQSAELARVHLAEVSRDSNALRELMIHGDAVVQAGAFEALAAIDSEGAVAALREEFADKSSLYRLQTLQLFERSSHTNSAESLQPLFEEAAKDSNPLVRDYAKGKLNK